MQLNEVEREIIGLWVVCGSLDSLVNHALLKLAGDGQMREVHFDTLTHQQLFSILLLDFLEKADEAVTGQSGSCLEVLERICRTASFDQDGSVACLMKPVGALRGWLDSEITVDAWLPSISERVDLTIQRRESIRICGNISKHNLARLTGVANQLADILNRHGITVDMAKALRVLDDFNERFYTDIFNYHSTVIAETLNNVRWGIHDYLSREYRRALAEDAVDPVKYSFRFPEKVSHEFARFCSGEMMNSVRRKPCMEKFRANSVFELRY